MAVLIARDNGVAERLERTEFQVEKSMRDMLLRHPDMMPVYEIDEDIRLLTIKRELRVQESGSDKFADAVAVDRNGSIYLIETKLFRNPDKRQVVAQVLSYGASLWSSSQSYAEFLDVLNESCLDLFDRPFLDLAKEFFSLGEREMEAFRDALGENWNDGVFKFVVYMDRVGEDLRNLVTYLNKRSRFDLYLVGVDYYKKEGVEIIIPKLYGVPDRKETGPVSHRKAQPPSGLSREEFLDSAKEKIAGDFTEFLRIYDFLRNSSGDEISFRSNAYGGSYTPRFERLGNVGPYSLKADGTLQIYLNYLEQKGLQSEAEMLRGEMVRSSFVPADLNSKQPMIRLPDWVGRTEELMRALSSIVDGA